MSKREMERGSEGTRQCVPGAKPRRSQISVDSSFYTTINTSQAEGIKQHPSANAAQWKRSVTALKVLYFCRGIKIRDFREF